MQGSAARLFALVSALAGCGRVGFAELDDPDAFVPVCAAPAGHDEDADGIDDACDGCPHLADAAQPDADGDGVDDGCDPRPDTPTESIAFFDPFTSMSSEWQFVGVTPMIDGDSLVADTRTSIISLRRLVVPTSETLIVGGYSGTDDSAPAQILLSNGDGAGAAFYCELEGPATATKIGATYTYGDGTYVVQDSSYGPGLRNAAFEMTFSFRAPDLTCTTTWSVPRPTVGGIIPADLSAIATRITLQAQNVEMRFDYFVQIHTE